ncbi:MAG: LPS-assembly protein LptD [Deltaproteobacteria bacterium]|nr:LPS-assembly protein LptD [Deltaproteobacteria bacterium]
MQRFRGKTNFIIFFLAVLTACLGGASLAVAAVPNLPGATAVMAAKTVEIEARYLYYDKQANLYHAQGDVVIRQEGMELKADKAILNQATSEFEAWGEVLLRDRSDYLACRYLKFNYRDQIGSIKDGRIFIKEKNYYITGEKIEKLGPNAYDVENATLTTCDAERAAWLIRCKKVQVKEGGYGIVDDAVFAVKNVPVLYLPKGVFPVNTQRQTGFLLPGIGYSDKDGVIVKNAFFWAINRSHDLTLYPEIYGERGVKFGAEYRYVINEQAQGDVSAFFMSDKLVEDDPAAYPDADRERWALGAHHMQTLQNGTRLKAAVNLVSDNEYLDDFPDTFSGDFIDELGNSDYKTDTYLRSLASAGHSWERYNITGEGRYYQSLLKENDDTTLQLLPELTFAARNQPVAGADWLFWQMQGVYTNFWRREGERGQRFDLVPSLTMPLKFGAFEVSPFLELRETYYQTNNSAVRKDGSASRESMAAGVEIKTVAERVYAFDWFGMDRLLHTLEPTVGYRYVPDVDQSDLPAFDDLDYLAEESNVSWALVSRLVGRYPRAGQPEQFDYHEWLKFQVGQAYSFIDVADGQRFFENDQHASDFFSKLELHSRDGGLYMKLENRFDPYQNANQLVTALLSTNNQGGDFLSLEYRYERDLAELFTGVGRLPLMPWLDVYGSIRYSLVDNHIWETIYGFNYHPQCWSLDFSIDEEHEPYDLSFRLLLSLNGLGGLGKN